jgi:hypothetical protein
MRHYSVNKRNLGDVPRELQARYELRVLKHTILIEVAWAASKVFGQPKAALLALQVIHQLDQPDEWWADKDGWLLQEWLDWAEGELNKTSVAEIQQSDAPAEGYHNTYVPGGGQR